MHCWLGGEDHCLRFLLLHWQVCLSIRHVPEMICSISVIRGELGRDCRRLFTVLLLLLSSCAKLTCLGLARHRKSLPLPIRRAAILRRCRPLSSLVSERGVCVEHVQSRSLDVDCRLLDRRCIRESLLGVLQLL